MKNILLSADGEVFVYSVSEEVVNNLEKYLNDFMNWMQNGKEETKKFRICGALCYDQSDFIEYINNVLGKKAVEVENLGWIDSKEEIPDKYKELIWYNF